MAFWDIAIPTKVNKVFKVKIVVDTITNILTVEPQ